MFFFSLLSLFGGNKEIIIICSFISRQLKECVCYCLPSISATKENTGMAVEKKYKPGPEVIIFSMLNSAEHEILIAFKCKKYQEIQLFQAQISLECYFFLLINVKMPTAVHVQLS